MTLPADIPTGRDWLRENTRNIANDVGGLNVVGINVVDNLIDLSSLITDAILVNTFSSSFVACYL